MNQNTNDIPRKLFLMIIYVLTMYIFATIFAILILHTLRVAFPNNPNNYNFTLTLTNLLCYAIMVFTFLFALDKYLYDEFQFFKKRFIYFLGIAFAGWIFNIFLGTIIEIIMELVKFTPRASQNQEAISETLKYPLLAIPMIVIGAPIVEEIIFRGVIFNFAKNLKLPGKLNIILAFVLSSSVFGLIHVLMASITSGDTSELILGIPYIAAGFVLTLVYYKTKNIFVPIAMHMIQNGFAVIVMLLFKFLPNFLPEEIPVKSLLYLLEHCHLI